MNEALKTDPKDNLKPWKPGESGNPAGRPRRGTAAADKLRDALAGDIPAILEKLVALAKKGDVGAAKAILERVLPPLKAVELPARLNDALAGSLTDQGRVILAAMSDGALTPGQAVQLLGALTSQAKLVEVDELSHRMAAIEKRLEMTNA